MLTCTLQSANIRPVQFFSLNNACNANIFFKHTVQWIWPINPWAMAMAKRIDRGYKATTLIIRIRNKHDAVRFTWPRTKTVRFCLARETIDRCVVGWWRRTIPYHSDSVDGRCNQLADAHAPEIQVVGHLVIESRGDVLRDASRRRALGRDRAAVSHGWQGGGYSEAGGRICTRTHASYASNYIRDF